MKNEKLYETIGQIDDELIIKANTQIKIRTKTFWAKWAAIAACFAVTCFSIVTITQKDNGMDLPNLPILTIGENMGTYGFEGYMAYDISELTNGNPWNENVSLDKLPVYKNQVLRDGAGVPLTGLDVSEMTEKITETANKLGITIGEISTIPTEQEIEATKKKDPSAVMPEKPYEAQASGDGITIKVDVVGVITVFFDTPLALPQKYSFTDYDMSYKQATDVVSYLIDKYIGLLQMNKPVLDILGEYNIYAQRSFSCSVYEAKGDISERIVNYAFNRASFYPDDNGYLSIIRRFNTDLSEKVGDYPIITPDKARELLLNGKYVTSVPLKISSEEYIAKVELVYRNSPFEQYFMPYYRFYVELPEYQRDNGLKSYGVYYVPAVEGQYINNMPTYDGRFN